MRTTRHLLMAAALVVWGCPPRTPPRQADDIQFWSLVKVTAPESTFAFKCLHQQSGSSLKVACFSPVEMPLFTVDIQENRVVTEASSPVVEEKIPFHLSRIGRDVWRAHVAFSDDDLASYSEQNDPDLPEDHISVQLDDQGRPLSKTFLAGDETVATVRFEDYVGEAAVAGRVELENVDPAYVIEIVQGQ